jgi:hypothetical protein
MKKLEPEMTAEELELIESLIKYPSLESVFDRNTATGFAEIKQKLQATVTNLERVIRRGEKADAERAQVVVTAYRTTIEFLSELERLGKNQSR